MAASKKTRRPSGRGRRPSEAKLDKMIEEAIVDAYGESEQIVGFYTMLEDNLALPFKTEILGVGVTVERLDLGHDEQIVAVCSRGKAKQRVPLLDLPLPSPSPAGADWIAAFRRWAKRRQVTTSDEPATIDRDKLRAAIRRLGPEYVFYMLDDAIDLLPLAELEGIAKKYLDIKRLRPDGDSQTKATLLADVRSFDKASRAGEYYESFMVNSRNYTAQSAGTTAWIATCNRLLDCCVADEKKSDAAEIRAAFDILFGLLDYIDQGNDEVIFFADEGGSWQVGVDWVKILPSWFRVFSITATPEEYAERITSLIRHHCNCDREKILAAASECATTEQREALAKAPNRQTRGHSQGKTP